MAIEYEKPTITPLYGIQAGEPDPLAWFFFAAAATVVVAVAVGVWVKKDIRA